MASDESGDSLLDSGIADDLSINGYEALFEQIQRMKAESGLTSRSGDPNQIMDESKRLQEEDYAGISGYLRYGAHQLYGRRWSEQDPALAAQEYENAKQAGATAGQHEAFNLSGDSNRNNLAALYAQLGDAAAVAMASSPIQGQILEVQQQYDRNLAYIKQFQNKKFTDFNGLFRSQTQLDNTLSELMRRASVVRDETVTRLQDHELAVQRDDADTLAALKLAGSGDTAGGAADVPRKSIQCGRKGIRSFRGLLEACQTARNPQADDGELRRRRDSNAETGRRPGQRRNLSPA